MRKKFLCILVLFVSIVLASEYTDAFNFTYNVALKYGVSQERAKLIAETVAEEFEHFPAVPYQVFVALIVSESGFRNVYGDSGKAVGYCQLHQSAVWYVSNFFPDIREKIKKIPEHSELIKYPALQIKIAYRYLYLIMRNITSYNIIEALNFWNNNPKYYVRIFNILGYIESLVYVR